MIISMIKGRYGKSKMLTRAVYVYRLCLEWGRLTSDDRDAMTYKG